jgi:hypothetical protein
MSAFCAVAVFFLCGDLPPGGKAPEYKEKK